MRKTEPHYFQYLRRHGNLVFLGLKGPRGRIHSIALTQADMTRLIDEYARSRAVPLRQEGKAVREELHQIIRLGRETAVVVPMATYRRMRELDRQLRTFMGVELTEALTVGQWQVEQKGQASAGKPPKQAPSPPQSEAPGHAASSPSDLPEV